MVPRGVGFKDYFLLLCMGVKFRTVAVRFFTSLYITIKCDRLRLGFR